MLAAPDRQELKSLTLVLGRDDTARNDPVIVSLGPSGKSRKRWAGLPAVDHRHAPSWRCGSYHYGISYLAEYDNRSEVDVEYTN